MPDAIPQLRYRIVRELPHDTADFTQGLEIDGDQLIESAGRYGESALMVKDLGSGRVVRARRNGVDEFAEGATLLGGKIFQLTWREHVAHVYDRELREITHFAYDGEGWGLANDGSELIQSDGSSRIQFRAPLTFKPTHAIDVRAGGVEVPMLNELEFASGKLYANVWETDRIAVIAPESGTVEAWLDLSALRARFAAPPGWNEREHVLNGIAYEPRSGHFYVTGKCWPVLFEIALEPAR